MDRIEFNNLILELTQLPNETEWMEFKQNNVEPDKIGSYLSALSNSAALLGKGCAYIVWGIDDKTHNLKGTTFKPHKTKIGNENIENWLLKLLDPRIDFSIHEGMIDGKNIVLFEIPSAPNRPVSFKSTKYIRVGSYTKKLRDLPEKERALWRIFDQNPFEQGVAKSDTTSDEVLSLINYPKYFHMMNQPLPDNRAAILERLQSEQIIFQKGHDRYDIYNVGAILFGRQLKDFSLLARKALRVIIYNGNSRIEATKEHVVDKGYAVGFEGAISYINDQLPQNEQIEQALRKEVKMFPQIAIRELVANTLIHQDFNVSGSGPMVELFSDRMEITNPGAPLIDPLRFIDEPPRSRNEYLASLMRRMNICEERGSGIDKVIFQVEVFQLPAPDFRVTQNSTIAILYGPRQFSQMNREERIRACYQHACLQHVSGKYMANASLRKRLGIKDKNYPLASRIIRDSIEAKLIKPYRSASESKRDICYVPFWA